MRSSTSRCKNYYWLTVIVPAAVESPPPGAGLYALTATLTLLPGGGGGGLLLLPTPPQPPINSSTRTVVSVAPKTSRRLRGIAASIRIPKIAAQNAASSQNAPGPLGVGAPGTTGIVLARDEVSRLAGTVTLNDVLVPPGNCGSAVLTPLLTPVELGVQITSEFELKFVPVTVSVMLAVAVAVVGEIVLSVGTGPSMLKFKEFCAPEMLTGTTPEPATTAAGTATVI